MAYRTILLHLDGSDNAHVRTQWAIQLASKQQAHLVGISAVGLSRYVFENALAMESMYPILQDLESARYAAQEAAQQFEEACHHAGLASFESQVVEDEAFGSLERQARYCDLLILGQYDSRHSINPMDASLARDMLLSNGGPLLLIPRDNTASQIERRILIAWNASIEAKRVVRDALPLLHMAEAVNIAVFDAGPQGEDFGARLHKYLFYHGISAGVTTELATYHDVHERLLATIADTNSNLLVMGGYGHTPFRETVLGGVTRAIFLSMPTPVLISH